MTMDRKAACLAQADAYRAMAQADPANGDRWIEQSIKWLERAIDPTGGLSMTFETKDEQQLRSEGVVAPIVSSRTLNSTPELNPPSAPMQAVNVQSSSTRTDGT
jgi:hypothetical protein